MRTLFKQVLFGQRQSPGNCEELAHEDTVLLSEAPEVHVSRELSSLDEAELSDDEHETSKCRFFALSREWYVVVCFVLMVVRLLMLRSLASIPFSYTGKLRTCTGALRSQAGNVL